MRICLVTSSFPRYAGDYSGFVAYDQAIALSRNHEVHVIYPSDVEDRGEFKDQIIRHPISYPFKSYPLAQVHGRELLKVPGFVINMALAVRRLRSQGNLDLIYAFWTIPAGFVCSLTHGHTPILLGILGSDLEVFGRQRLTKPFIRNAIRHATRIVAVSNDLKAETVGLGAKDSDVAVIPTGVDTNQFKPMDKESLRQRLGLRHTFTWLYSGSLLKLKRVDMVLRAAAALKSGFDFQVQIVGDGPERGQLEGLARNLGLDNVIFRGRIPRADMPLYVASSDVLLLFSETEGLPNCIQEAMAAGVTVVCTRVGGMPDIVKPGSTGYLVDDESGAVDALRDIMSSPELVSKLGSQALSFARKSLSLDSVLARIIEQCEIAQARSLFPADSQQEPRARNKGT